MAEFGFGVRIGSRERKRGPWMEIYQRHAVQKRLKPMLANLREAVFLTLQYPDDLPTTIIRLNQPLDHRFLVSSDWFSKAPPSDGKWIMSNDTSLPQACTLAWMNAYYCIELRAYLADFAFQRFRLLDPTLMPWGAKHFMLEVNPHIMDDPNHVLRGCVLPFWGNGFETFRYLTARTAYIATVKVWCHEHKRWEGRVINTYRLLQLGCGLPRSACSILGSTGPVVSDTLTGFATVPPPAFGTQAISADTMQPDQWYEEAYNVARHKSIPAEEVFRSMDGSHLCGRGGYCFSVFHVVSETVRTNHERANCHEQADAVADYTECQCWPGYRDGMPCLLEDRAANKPEDTTTQRDRFLDIVRTNTAIFSECTMCGVKILLDGIAHKKLFDRGAGKGASGDGIAALMTHMVKHHKYSVTAELPDSFLEAYKKGLGVVKVKQM